MTHEASPADEANASAEGLRDRLRRLGEDPRLDLAGIEQALADGARAVLLSHPHNPTGVLHSRAELAELARIAARHDAVVVSDEIWAPLAMPGVDFVSFLAVSQTAREVGLGAAAGEQTERGNPA